MEKILFANIGWMMRYNGYLPGEDEIQDGGSYPNENKHEVFNFKNIRGHYYGYVNPKSRDGIIDLGRIDKTAKNTDRIDGITVIWTAKRPEGGRYIIGWYKNATVFKQIKNNNPNNKDLNYNIVAKAKDGVLLNVDERTVRIPRGKGFLGQSNIWYADDKDVKEVEAFKQKVLDYINGEEKKIAEKQTKEYNKPFVIDVEKKEKVERAAIEFVTNYYNNLGYKVKSVEKDNKGWDLEAGKDKITLHIEVKGLSGSETEVRLSKNEYNKLNRRNPHYRLCIVNNVLTNNIKLAVFAWENRQFKQQDIDGEVVLSFNKHISYTTKIRKGQ